jgi:hypothetical protein
MKKVNIEDVMASYIRQCMKLGYGEWIIGAELVAVVNAVEKVNRGEE